ncbi:Peroxisomal membrane signal receptor PTS1 [Marasmius crinis-equi]|uniref:Peroxisomal membrane signal receptor PTS1 n=1 Tax=Marasmius crinis-equi TaxID=585013 RepID=A0ABR3FS51_9AGAR
MSFQNLISGAECSTAANPLSQVLKHTEGDRSLQQLQYLPGSSSAAASQQDLALARQFFEGNNTGTQHPFVVPPEFAREMQGLSSPMSDAWVAEQQQQMRAFQANKTQPSQWAAEFGGPATIQHSVGPTARSSSTDRESSSSAMDHKLKRLVGLAQQTSMYMQQPGLQAGFPFRSAFSGPAMMQSYNPDFLVDKGKGKSREADFEAAFDHYAASIEKETPRIVDLTEDVERIQETLKETKLDDDELTANDFRTVWDQMQNSDAPPPQEDLAKWEAEFNQLMNAQRDELEYDYGSAMQQAWENGGSFPETLADKALQFDKDGLPILDVYKFESENKYLDPSTSSSSMLDQAKALLEQNGSLSEAALLLEAAIQKGDLGEGGYEAWILLGETRNMDEREELGMRALTEGVKRAESAGAGGAGMVSLAISYTNESMDRSSHVMLLRWLMARYPDRHVPEETVKAMSTNSPWDTHTRITELFLSLARDQHSKGVVDPDVQIALGVLFYTNGEYDRAKDCFETALTVRPSDYLLWNRLGSSLSNGNKPEEALGAYKEALHLRPTYTRAIYNVGVACLNIGAHKEAAEHFLSALALQLDTSGDTSEQVWFTLRRTLLAMNRTDLAEHANQKVSGKGTLEMFRKEGFDF